MLVLYPNLDPVLDHGQFLLGVQDAEGTELGDVRALQQGRDEVAPVCHHAHGGENAELRVELVGVLEILGPERVWICLGVPLLNPMLRA